MNSIIKKDTLGLSPGTPQLPAEASLLSIEERASCQSGNGHMENGTPLGNTLNINANCRLLKSIMPKTAFEVLNELEDVFIDNYTSIGSPKEGYTVSINMNNKEFEAKGRSKKDTENLVYELALRDFFTSKLNDTDKAQEVKDEAKLHILSYALHKLFNQWEQEGYLVPSTQFSTDLPIDWQTMSPVTLLQLMRKDARFVEYDFCGGKENVKPRVSIFVDNQEFTTSGRNKLTARYNAAVLACNALLQTNFTANMEDENCISPSVQTSTASPDSIKTKDKNCASPTVKTFPASPNIINLEDDKFADLPVKTSKASKAAKQTVIANLPTDWHKNSAYNLLLSMRPAATFNLTRTQHASGIDIHDASTSIDKQTFTSWGPNRVMAIENLSAIVCNKLFNTTFIFYPERKVLAGYYMPPKDSQVVQPALCTKLPNNWKCFVPHNMLLKMRPNTNFIYTSSFNALKIIVHHVSTSVDGKKFAASAKTKKLATKKLTIEVCNKLFNTDYK